MRNRGGNNNNYLKYRQNELPYQYSISTTEDGKTRVEFLDKSNERNQYYNTTSLIIDNKPIYINGCPIHRCNVGWYNDDDTIMFGVKRENTEVLAEIDPSLMRHDEEYTCAVMAKLLNRERVEKYMKDGMSKTPLTPCGNFIGAIKQKDDGIYIKYFDKSIGATIHNSRYMSEKRRREEEAKTRRAMQRKYELNDQIRKLQEKVRNIDRKYNLSGPNNPDYSNNPVIHYEGPDMDI